MFDNLRVGYVPYSDDLMSPGDRRRFVYYSNKRGIDFEIADPSSAYDIVYVTHGADITVWSKYNKAKVIIYEIIDSYLAVSSFSFFGFFRGLGKYISRQYNHLIFDQKKSIKAMCRRADVVICSTEEQKDFIKQYCNNIHIILDVKSMYHNYKIASQFQSTDSVLNIVWEGLPHNIKSFTVIREALSTLSKLYQINIHLITSLKYKKYMNRYITKHTVNEIKKYIDISNVYLYQWNELTVSHISSACDLAIIPINSNDPMDQGKPEDKLLIFWLMGLPTIVSETPSHLRAMNNAGLSMTCNNTNDWVNTIKHMADNKDIRNQAAQKGFIYASRANSEEKIMSLWDNMFSSIIDTKIN